ncbi:hypothetical protein BGX31_004626, partial [Mortierella sp. GBA43]
MIVGVLAILKSGGAYVPLDPAYANERLIDILVDCAPTIILADTVGQDTLSTINVRRLGMEVQGSTDSTIMINPNDLLSTSSTNPIVAGLTPNHLSYIIYTSGSTGKPKGVMIEHQGVVNHTTTRLEDFNVTEDSQVMQFSPLNFDLSVLDMFAAFNTGATLHVMPNIIRMDRHKLWDYMEQHSITLAVLPPAVLLNCKGLPPLSTPLTVVSTGDELSVSLLQVLREQIPNGTVINEYGATEVT